MSEQVGREQQGREQQGLGPGARQALAGDLRAALGHLVRRLREQGQAGEFTRSQASVLRLLERDGPTTMTALARAEGVRPQSMSVIVATLQEAGLVEGVADPKDGRKTVLSLTDAGRDKFASGRLAREDWLFHAIGTQLTPAEQRQLAVGVDLLKRLAQ
jgi:DNA-binding MarR family transcriptional regulator